MQFGNWQPYFNVQLKHCGEKPEAMTAVVDLAMAEQVTSFSSSLWWNFCFMPSPGCILSAIAFCPIERGDCEGLRK